MRKEELYCIFKEYMEMIEEINSINEQMYNLLSIDFNEKNGVDEFILFTTKMMARLIKIFDDKVEMDFAYDCINIYKNNSILTDYMTKEQADEVLKIKTTNELITFILKEKESK